MNHKLKIILILVVLLAAAITLVVYFQKDEEPAPSGSATVTYCWDLKDGWQLKFPGTWENNYKAEKVTTEQGNVTTFYYAPQGKKTNDKLMILGVMTKENWAAIAEASRPGTLLEERDGYVYYSSFPAKAESSAKQYKQMFAEAKDAKFQTIKKTPNLPNTDQPIMGSSGSNTSETSGSTK